MAEAYASDKEALGELLAAGGRQEWNSCVGALEFLLRERLNGAPLGSYTPANDEEASGMLSVLAEAGLHEAPKGHPVRTLYDAIASAVDASGDVDDAFQEIMDI